MTEEGIERCENATANLTDSRLIAYASGGLALQGVLISKDVNDQLQSRQILLNVSQDVKLSGPTIHPSEDFVDFFSRESEDLHKKSINSFGFGLKAALLFPAYAGAVVKASAAVGFSYESKTVSKTHMQSQYSSRVKHCIIPKGSYSFQMRDVRFSPNATADLKSLEASIKSFGENSVKVQKDCCDFLVRYGSHICMGPINFGGIYLWTCYSEGFYEEELRYVQRIQSEVFSTEIGVSCEGVDVSGEVSIDHVKGKYTGEFKSNALSKTHLITSKNGGPAVACSLPKWKKGLEKNNSTWSVIGRETSFTPIWKIIRSNYIDEFTNATLLAKILRKNWSVKTGLCVQSHEFSDILDDVSQWCKDLEMSKIEEHLEQLVEIKRKLKDEKGNFNLWTEKYLPEMVIQKFLMIVVDNYDSILQSSSHKALLRSSLCQLIHDNDINKLKSEEYQEKVRHILDYTSSTKHSTSEDFIECTNIKSLLAYLEKAKEMLLMKERAHDPTITVAKAINSLRCQFGNEQIYDDLFILTLMSPFTRTTSVKEHENLIINQLSHDDIEYLCIQMKQQAIMFNKFKIMSDFHSQAYLFKIFVQMFRTRKPKLSEERIIEHLHYMEKRIGDKLEGQIVNILSNIEKHDWDKLECDLDSILQKETASVEETGDKLFDILNDDTHVHISEHQISQEVKNSKIQEMFTELDLINSISDCIAIQSNKLEVSKCTDPKLLPMLILHKIMTYDIRCRGVLLNCDQEELTNSYDSDDLFSDDDTCDAVSASSPFTIHPQDGLLAVLCCADDFVRQDLIARLVTCQFAVPLIFPEPFNNTLTITLWGMRSIVKEWKTSEGISREYPLIAYPMPIIVFLRFDRHEKSKSKILNTVISQNITCYNHFFHQDCEGGDLKRILGEGLVDICWYLPTGKADNDTFPDTVAFLNLHGDARKHKRQISLLSKMSSMCFILLKDNDLNDDGMEIIKYFSGSPGGIVLLRIADHKLAEEKKAKT